MHIPELVCYSQPFEPQKNGMADGNPILFLKVKRDLCTQIFDERKCKIRNYINCQIWENLNFLQFNNVLKN